MAHLWTTEQNKTISQLLLFKDSAELQLRELLTVTVHSCYIMQTTNRKNNVAKQEAISRQKADILLPRTCLLYINMLVFILHPCYSVIQNLWKK